MSDTAFLIEVRQACKLVVKQSIAQRERDNSLSYSYVDLPDEQISLLAGKIDILPSQYRDAILLRYGCSESYQKIGEFLSIQNPKGTIEFAKNILSSTLTAGQPISPASLSDACDILLNHMTLEESTDMHIFSDRHKKRMHSLFNGTQAAWAPSKKLRRLLLVALITALIIGTTIGVVAMLGRNFFKWDIRKDDEGTHVEITEIMRELTEEDFEEMYQYQPGWLPNGFTYAYSGDEQVYALFEYYHSDDGQRIVFRKQLPVEYAGFSFDETSGSALEEIEINGNQAYYFERVQDGRPTVYWQQDGYLFQIVSPLDKESTIQIAESVAYKK